MLSTIMLEKTIFCENCRSKVSGIDNLFFIEDESDRGFCSEDCIKAFYKPFMETLEQEELIFRRNLNLSQEDDSLYYLTRQDLLDEAIYLPEEVWLLVNEVEQKFYTHIKTFFEDTKKYYLILICSYVDEGASFVFYRTVTEFESLVNSYRRSTEMALKENSNSPDMNEASEDIPMELIETLDRKKSLFLAELLSHRNDEDISFELFMDYEKYLKDTMRSCDETYAFEDDEGDEIFTFIKSFLVDDESFYTIALCYPYKVKQGIQMLPILSFPSRDDDLYPHYIRGRKINEKLKS